MMEEMYKLAKNAYEKDGREIVNCTDGGNLELFRRSKLVDELPSSIVIKDKKIMNAEEEKVLVGTFSREDSYRFDETHLICDYFDDGTNGIMVDVGAHHGSACKPFLDKGWKVLAFEPDPNNREILENRLGLNENIMIYNEAVSNETGNIVPFYASDESTGISGMLAFREGHREICQVETITLKDVCEKNNISNIDFLKIDSEGYDFFVLKGLDWENITPDIIECEFEDLKTEKLGYYFDELAQFLVDRGYFVYVSEWHPIIRYGVSHEWCRLVSYPCILNSKQAWGNLLAFKKKPNETLISEIINKKIAIYQADHESKSNHKIFSAKLLLKTKAPKIFLLLRWLKRYFLKIIYLIKP